MRNRTRIAIALTFITLSACGTDSTSPQTSRNESSLAENLGIQFHAPDGWKITTQEETSIILENTEEKQKALMIYDFQLNRQSIDQLATKRLEVSDSLSLVPENKAERIDDANFTLSYRESKNGSQVSILASLRPSSSQNSIKGGIITILLGAENYKEAKKALMKFNDALELRPAQVDEELQEKIAVGEYVDVSQDSEGDRNGSYVGQKSVSLTLCQNRFFYDKKDESYISVPGAGSMSRNDSEQSSGTFQIISFGGQPLLHTIDDNTQEVMMFPLSVDKLPNELVIDGALFRKSGRSCERQKLKFRP